MAKILRPNGLLRLAVRRTNRAIAHARYRRVRAWTAQRLSQALAPSPPEAARLGLRGLSTEVWCHPEQRASAVAAVDSIPDARQRAIAAAEQALSRAFQLFGHTVSYGPRAAIDWSLEPVARYRYPMVAAHQLSLFRPGVDPKFPWALGRMDQLLALAQGFWLTGRRDFVAEVVTQLREFLWANPVGRGIQWASPMEVALRAANIAIALRMCSDAADVQNVEWALEVLAGLANHCEFVRANLEDETGVPNNHLIANHLGLLVVGLLFPHLPGAGRWVAEGARGLRTQMDAQVHPDGVSFEGSIPYHRLVLEMFTLGYIIGRAHGLWLGTAFEERLRRMFHFAEAYCSERGQAPQIGDNDSGRVLPLRERMSLDHGYLAPLGAALLGDRSLKRAGDAFPDEAAWLLGEGGHERFHRMMGQAGARSFSSPRGGIHVLKGADATLTICAGPAGQRGVGGHSHNHKLSFELHLHGVPVIVDPGSPTYTREPVTRNAFRSTSAHNTLQVDHREHSPLELHRLFALPDVGRCLVRELNETGQVPHLTARLEGYPVRNEAVSLERVFSLHREARALVIRDRLEGLERHLVQARLHLPDASVRLRAPTPAEQARALGAGWTGPIGSQAAELGPSPGRAVVLFDPLWSVECLAEHYSPGYGRWVSSAGLQLRADVMFPTQTGIIILFR